MLFQVYPALIFGANDIQGGLADAVLFPHAALLLSYGGNRTFALPKLSMLKEGFNLTEASKVNTLKCEVKKS